MNKQNDMIVCPKCGTRITGGLRVCSVCGHNFDPTNDNVPNDKAEYDKYIRENSDDSSNKDAAGLIISGLIAKIALPIVAPFVAIWFFFGGLNGDKTEYWKVLIIGIVILIALVVVPFKFTYNLAAKESSSKDKKIFAIGMLLLVIAIVLFYFFYIKR